jgi:hypothetical protein
MSLTFLVETPWTYISAGAVTCPLSVLNLISNLHG